MKVRSHFLSRASSFTKDLKERESFGKFSDIALNSISRVYNSIPLSRIIFTTQIEKTAIDMSKFTIFINPEYISELSKYLKTTDLIEGLIELELSSYLYHPYDLKRDLLQLNTIREVKGGKKNIFYYNLINKFLRVVIKNRESKIPLILSIIQPVDGVDLGVRVYLQPYTELKLYDDKDISEPILNFVDSIKSIDFLNIENGKPQFVKKSDKQNCEDLLNFCFYSSLLDRDEDNDGEADFKDLYDQIVTTPDEIKETLSDLMKEGKIEQEDIGKLLNDETLKKIIDPPIHDRENENRFREGEDYKINPALYEILVKQNRIRSTKVESKPVVGIYPSHLQKFEVGDPIQNLDLFNSFGGRIYPGVSNSWVKKPINYHRFKDKLPDLTIFIDDSSSMPDPLEKVSEAVLGSLMLINEYIDNGAKCSIVKFSDRTEIMPLTNIYKKLESFILSHKSGYDTFIELDKIEELLKHNTNNDIIIISDGIIKNHNQLLTYISQFEKSRVFYFNIISKKEINYRRNIESSDFIKVFTISKASDLYNLVLDK
ncbi:MAG: hypothetical protein CR982_06580 [Candidatus Cloacimonadota bacterium]|nr:MAG: hypothetical protein CR982_06580 [Candidatus Cloacimonadota bacterium]PIE79955.1 MAG: hypothetical protein CSA15_02500 [Candidatus Delongbacteria bacterium]